MPRTQTANRIVAVFSLAAVLAAPLAAQDRAEQPNLREMEARLQDQHVLFGVIGRASCRERVCLYV